MEVFGAILAITLQSFGRDFGSLVRRRGMLPAIGIGEDSGGDVPTVGGSGMTPRGLWVASESDLFRTSEDSRKPEIVLMETTTDYGEVIGRHSGISGGGNDVAWREGRNSSQRNGCEARLGKKKSQL